MYMKAENIESVSEDAIKAAIGHAAYAIPPAWPLAATVAVNPFLGQTGEPFSTAGSRLRRIAGISVTMPRTWYLEKIDSGEVTRQDLAQALDAAVADSRPRTVDRLLAAAKRPTPKAKALETIADLAAQASGVDWPGLIAERISAWASSYFDEGQALWPAAHDKAPYSAWRAFAIHDLTPEISGLYRFSSFVQQWPLESLDAISSAAQQLGLSEDELPGYFHQLLFSMGGWSQYGRYQLWQAELAGYSSRIMQDLLAVRLAWEAALHRYYAGKIASRWSAVRAKHRQPAVPDEDALVDEILQEATERAKQREVIAHLQKPRPFATDTRPKMQAVFCIDVRSEVFRRNLESVSPGIETKGFAGFFGLPVEHQPLASDVKESRLPVLLNPAVHSCAGESQDADQRARFKARAKRAWGRFKVAAGSSFAFVEASGIAYGIAMFASSLGISITHKKKVGKPVFADGPCIGEKVDMAERILRAMSMTDNLAPVILLVGHGATVANNPHESALHCGACGGHSGDINARLLASVLNEPEVRGGLKARGIVVPEDTVFVGALHDTTTDDVTLFSEDLPGETAEAELHEVRGWLAGASKLSRAERALRLPHAGSANSLRKRAGDWAETRAEWGLAGCHSFIAAPRRWTAAAKLHGRAFLHDYDWRHDSEFAVLELILTAPVVVASWISLQYYGSTVAPEAFGGGNKLLHNVVGGFGVVEGNGGQLRVGLPWQSIHDGERYVHDPVRLSVFIAAPRQAIGDVLAKHPEVRQLFDNRWLHLFAVDDSNGDVWRYAGDLEWSPEILSA